LFVQEDIKPIHKWVSSDCGWLGHSSTRGWIICPGLFLWLIAVLWENWSQ